MHYSNMDILQYPVKDIRDLLDATNLEEIALLKDAFPVEFRLWEVSHYSSVIKTKDVPTPTGIVLYYEPLSQAKIYHELLHLHCSAGFGTNYCMCPTDEDDVFYKMIITDQFCEYFLNNAEHTIIYPYYKDKGYDPGDFFEPFIDPAEPVKEFRSHPFKKDGKYQTTMIQNYLKLCVFLMSFPIDNRCKKLLKEIRLINAPLYYLCNHFFNDYADTELIPENGDYIQQCYQDFRDGVASWIHKNQQDITPF